MTEIDSPQNEPSDLMQVSSLTVLESQERANIDMLIATAKKYPRDIARVKRTMEAMATLDEETAESCNYHLERNGKAIDGPSVRMAEIAVSAYQNIRCGSRVIANDGKVITGQAFCHDLENNTFIAWETQRRITDKTGRTYGEDMQVLTGNAASAIAFRNAVFKVIPGALIKSVAEKARQVAVGDIKTLAQRRARALHKFASLGISHARVLEFLNKPSVEHIDIADVERLFGVFTAIREGSSSIDEQFPPKGKVVSPHFEQAPNAPGSIEQEPGGESIAQPEKEAPMPAREPQTAKRGPGRPRKTEKGELFDPPALKEPEPPTSQLSQSAQEVLHRLQADNLEVANFIRLMQRNAYAPDEAAEITDVDDDGLIQAIQEWPKVVKHLREIKDEEARPFA